jgi:major vault protein
MSEREHEYSEARRGYTQERDLVLAPNEEAFILDETKGHVVTYVGPTKASLGNTDKPVFFKEEPESGNPYAGKFEPCNLDKAIQTFVVAPEGWYVILRNPAKNENEAHPKPQSANNATELQQGHEIIIPGPVSFPIWPGQMTQVVPGHHLRSNQYLLVQVYDEESANKHRGQAVVKGKEGGDDKVPKKEKYAMGQLIIIKGTEVSFYIPPTGIRVVKEGKSFVRNAVSLERLEYCILLDENGEKKYSYGPDVVFPEPTEVFVERDGKRVFRFRELNPNMGIYVKVIADYEENGVAYKAGDELFITGKDTKIYRPRPEHAIIKYGEEDHHFAVAVPSGEARYVLNKETGEIDNVDGPKMFLPDPRVEVIVRRILTQKQVTLWFPGNDEAMEYNRHLEELRPKDGGDEAFITEREFTSKKLATAKPDKLFLDDEMERRESYTAPRTITIDTKYDGAVGISPWTGYAILVTSKTGKREVIVGPDTYRLRYDEILESMSLSTGTPKKDDKKLETVYLRVLHNKVSDKVNAETRDLVPVEITLSYRVNFEGDSSLWFNVEDYVKFLTDHTRSLIRNMVKKMGIEEFYSTSIDSIRDIVLGKQDEKGKRTGRVFEENGMRIYDVEVLDVRIEDSNIAAMLTKAQKSAVEAAIEISEERRNLDMTKEKEKIRRSIKDEHQKTFRHNSEKELEKISANLGMELQRIESDSETQMAELIAGQKRQDAKLTAEKDKQETLDGIHVAELKRKREIADAELDKQRQKLVMILEEKAAEVEAVVEKAKAIGPDMIAALQAFGDKDLAGKLADSMGPLAILGGKSIADVINKLLKGTPVEQILKEYTKSK